MFWAFEGIATGIPALPPAGVNYPPARRELTDAAYGKAVVASGPPSLPVRPVLAAASLIEQTWQRLRWSSLASAWETRRRMFGQIAFGR
jgi:hypothetical protein